ncbi:hypothetical protein [Rhodococcus zopfii]|uniref:hypothetical protein n=1 Tax=Rhodococcus zopfii TaxID=43772 RepID=UPI001485E23A|nr:hypothetical protein [Rhodococcus zopfii]
MVLLYRLTIAPEAAATVGRHKPGAAYLYITTLADVDLGVPAGRVHGGYAHMTTVEHRP